ncbi:MAG: response regulator transcription factor [Oscillospiraceae bacterium]|nr:response regulator transcription factor [Oscillospiraceae bacterium]
MLKIAICDDNGDIIKELTDFINEYGRNNNLDFEIYAFNDGEELLISEQKFDLIFLDIEMKRINGFEAAEHIRENDMNVPIVYITSHNGYFERAFKVHAFEYITKPLKQERLLRVMNDFFAAKRDTNEAVIQVLTNDGFISIKLNDIYSFNYEDKRKVYMYLEKERLLLRENMQDIYDKLDKTQFYMTRRDCIINLRYVHTLRNDYVIVMKNEMLMPLAQKKKDEFMKKISSVFIEKLKGQKI